MAAVYDPGRWRRAEHSQSMCFSLLFFAQRAHIMYILSISPLSFALSASLSLFPAQQQHNAPECMRALSFLVRVPHRSARPATKLLPALLIADRDGSGQIFFDHKPQIPRLPFHPAPLHPPPAVCQALQWHAIIAEGRWTPPAFQLLPYKQPFFGLSLDTTKAQ